MLPFFNLRQFASHFRQHYVLRHIGCGFWREVREGLRAPFSLMNRNVTATGPASHWRVLYRTALQWALNDSQAYRITVTRALIDSHSTDSLVCPLYCDGSSI
jgi:hypothetical protein